MGRETRKLGLDVIGEAPWGTHLCQFYATSEDLADILVPYIKAGLENNEYCMWVTSNSMPTEQAKAALAKAVDGLDDYTKRGQIEIIDAGQWYTRSGEFDAASVLQG